MRDTKTPLFDCTGPKPFCHELLTLVCWQLLMGTEMTLESGLAGLRTVRVSVPPSPPLEPLKMFSTNAIEGTEQAVHPSSVPALLSYSFFFFDSVFLARLVDFVCMSSWVAHTSEAQPFLSPSSKIQGWAACSS